MSKVVAIDHRWENLDVEAGVLASYGVELVDARALDREAALQASSDATGVLLGARFRFDADAILRIPACQVIVRYGIGFDNVDVAAATAAGIAVAYVPDYCTEEVAVHAIAGVLALNRRLHELDARMRAGGWGVPAGLEVRRLSSSVLGVVGCGRIGEAVVRRAVALGMRAVAYDPQRAPRDIAAVGAEPVPLERLLAEADFVSLHAPPTPDGKPLLGHAEFASMREGASLVNVGRAALVDEDELVAALRSGRLAGAALDVTAQEPLHPPGRLFDLPNVVLTPHSAWYSREAVAELRTKAAQEVGRVLRGERPRFVASS